MQSMQTRVLDAIDHELTAHGLDAVQRSQYANTGHVYGMNGLTTYVDIEYGFQDTYCTITITADRLEGRADAAPTFRAGIGSGGAPKANTVAFLHLEYTNADRIAALMDIVADACPSKLDLSRII